MNFATRAHDQAIKDAIQALRYEAGLSKRVLSHLRGLERDLKKALSEAGDITSQRKLKALLKEARAAIADRFEAAQGLFDDEIPQFAGIQADKLVEGLNGIVKVDLFRAAVTSDQMQAIASDVLIEGAPSAEWWAAQEASTMQAFTNAVRGGMVRGATIDEMAAEIQALMGTSRRNAAALVRTSVITVNNAAHLAVYEANADLMAGLQWVATLDPRTCSRCGALDGQTWEWGKSHPTPSLHWGCRCMMIPKTKSWEQLAREAGGNTDLARKLDAMPEGTRASMDGQVSAKTTYEDWLSRQPAEMQAQILGPARQRLYASGKLTLRDLTDQAGNELTLAELKAAM